MTIFTLVDIPARLTDEKSIRVPAGIRATLYVRYSLHPEGGGGMLTVVGLVAMNTLGCPVLKVWLQLSSTFLGIRLTLKVSRRVVGENSVSERPLL